MQQLGLQGGLHLADFVEHQRAAVGLLEFPDPGGGRAGERSALVSEELAFEQLRRKRGTVHLHERPVPAGGALMNRPRHQLLADPALPSNQHGDVAVGNLLDHLGDAPHLLAVAPHRTVFVIAQLLAELAQLRHQPVLLDGVLDGDVERDLSKSLGIVRLDDVVGRAETHGFDNGRGLVAS